MREYIICSAIHFEDNCKRVHGPKNIDTGFVICGRRHHDCFNTLKTLSDLECHYITEKVQGFLTSTNRFVDRKEAFQIARCANQIQNLAEWDQDSVLVSEDLY